MSISSKYPSVRPTKVINLSKETLLNSSVEYSRGGVGTYIDENGLIVSAAPDQPRFNHDLETLEYKGLLVEESRTNVVTNQNLNDSNQGVTNDPETSVISPFGTTTGVRKLQCTAGLGGHGSVHGGSLLTVKGTASIYVKKGNHRYVGIESRWNVAGGYCLNIFDFDTEDFTRGGNISSKEKLANGWYRITATRTYDGNSPTIGIALLGSDTSIFSWTATGDEYCYFIAPQLEAGSFPTSYIPTFGSAATRPADFLSVPLPGSVVKSGRVGFTPEQSLNTYAPSFALKDSSLPAKPYVLELGSVNSAPVASVVYNSVRQGTTSIPALPATAPSLKSTLSFNFEPTTGAVEISSTASDDADSHVLALPAELSRPVPSDQTLDLFEVNGEGGSINLREIYLWEVALSTEQLASVSGELKSIGQPIELSTGVNKNSDYADAGARPTLDLRFAERKDLFDDTTEQNLVTFSRGSIGTYVDENGIVQTAAADEPRFDHDPVTGESLGLLVEEARTNYAVKPFFNFTPNTTNSTLIPNYALAPDGTFTAALLNGGMEVTNVAVIDKRLFSIFIKKVSSDVFTVYLTQGGGDATLTFTFSTETISNPQGSIINMGYRKYPNGWYRIYGQVATTGGSVNWRPIFYSNLENPTNGQTCLVWGHQDEVGSFPTSYIPTPATFTSRASTATYYDANGVIQTAATDVARDDAYFPDENGIMRPAGLLLEAVGTNRVIRSEEFDNSHWVLGTTFSGIVNVTANQTSAPNGSLTADLVTLSAVTNKFGVGTSTRTAVIPDTANTLSVFVKAKELDKVWVGYWDSGAGPRHLGSFNLSTQSWYGTSTYGERSYQALANGWFRLIFTFTPSAIGGRSLTILIPNPDGTPPSNDRNASGLLYDGTPYAGQGLYIWGAQLEASPYPTSYIPTTSSTVTRAADVSSSSTITRATDVASISGEYFNPLSSTFVFTEASITSNFGDRQYATLDGTNGSNRLFFLNNFFTSGPDGQFIYTIPAISANGSSANYALTFNYDGSITEKAYAKDGVLTPTATMSGLRIPTTGLVFNFGANNSGMIPIRKTFKRITYWPVRLPDTTLQVLTDPAISTWDLVFDSSLSADGTCAIITASTCTYAIDWGDGTPTQTINATGTFAATHRYTFPQTYKAKIEVLSGAFRPYYNNSAYADQLVEIGPSPDGWTNTSTSGFGTDLGNAWYGANNLRVVDKELNTLGVTNFITAWSGCSSLTSFPLLDTSSGTSFYSAWVNCSSLTSFPLIDTSNGTSFGVAWSGCSSLTSFPLLDTSNGTDFGYAWRSCNSLTSFPLLNTSSGINFKHAWQDCSSLTSFPLLDTSNGTNFGYAWGGCTGLTTFPANFFDSWTAAPANYCFYGAWNNCTSLTPASVENILNSLSISPSSSTPPASGTDITITYNATVTPGPDITVPAIDLVAKGWDPRLNGVATDPYALASLDLDFATNLSLTDNISGNNLITFSRGTNGTYVDSNGVIQTAGPDTPRFDHDPDTLESLGLLVEELRINYASQSLVAVNSTLVSASDTTYAPVNFESKVHRFTIGSSGIQFYIPLFNAPGYSTVGLYDTLSFYLKSDNPVTISSPPGGSPSLSGLYFSNNTTTAFSTEITTEPGPLGFTRYSIKYSGLQTNGNTITRAQITVDGTGDFYVFGAQWESRKNFPTSYIPTAGTMVTRTADAASISGTDLTSWFNQSEGTFRVRGQNNVPVSAGNAGGMRFMSVSTGPSVYQDTTYNFLSNTQNFGGMFMTRAENGTDYNVYSYLGWTNTFPMQTYVGGYDSTSSTIGYNNLSRTQSFNFTLQSDLSHMWIGQNHAFAPNRNHINRISYWPKKLTDKSIQFLSQ